MSDADPRRRECLAVAGLVALAASVRIAAAVATPYVRFDGGRYATMALYFSEGRWDEGLSVWPRQTPLYPLLLWVFGSGVAVSIAAGSLAVVPIYALARAVWDRRVATLAALVVALLPEAVVLGSQVAQEPTLSLFFFSALEATRRWAERPRPALAALAGVLAALASLARPEGSYAVAAFAGWTVVRGMTLREWGARAAGALVYVAAFCAVTAPYARWIHDRTGRWDVSDTAHSQQLKARLGLAPRDVMLDPWLEVSTTSEPHGPQLMTARFGYVPGRLLHFVNRGILRNCTWALAPFLILGLLQARRRAGDAFVLAAAAGFCLPPLVMLMLDLVFVNRHTLVGILLLAPFIALGILRAREWIARRFPSGGSVACAVAIALAAGLAWRGVSPKDAKRTPVARAGAWIRDHSPRHLVIVSDDSDIGYYADGFVEPVPHDRALLAAAVVRHGARWVVVTAWPSAPRPPVPYALAHVEPGDDRTILVYQGP